MTNPEFRPDFHCPVCFDAFVLTGDTPEARERAVAEFDGCCTPCPPTATATEPDVVGAPDPSASARSSVAEVRPGATRVVPSRSLAPGRLLARVPAWVRRRVANWPFGDPDYTT